MDHVFVWDGRGGEGEGGGGSRYCVRAVFQEYFPARENFSPRKNKAMTLADLLFGTEVDT